MQNFKAYLFTIHVFHTGFRFSFVLSTSEDNRKSTFWSKDMSRTFFLHMNQLDIPFINFFQ